MQINLENWLNEVWKSRVKLLAESKAQVPARAKAREPG